MLVNRRDFDSEWNWDLEKYHAFENDKLYDKWNHRQINIVSRFWSQHVVVFSSAFYQRCADDQQSDKQYFQRLEKSFEYASISELYAEHAVTDTVADCV
jgi:hypothetical protein